MTFNSYIFILVFLPLALLGWYGLNYIKLKKIPLLFITGMSLWFYGYFNPSYLWIIISTILCNYLLSLFLERRKEQVSQSPFVKTVVMIAAILLNLGILFYYKYFDFFLENINAVFGADYSLRHIILPLGISFFTFQQLSYIIDRCLGKAEHTDLLTYSAFVTFFPQLVAGPIVLHSELIPQLKKEEKRFNPDMFYDGLICFVLGLTKKVILADNFAIIVNHGYDNPILLDTFSTLAVIVAYAFELYFDFSGYSDMAIGLGKMFGIELPVNFRSPYKAATLKELWTRWHMTLTRFLSTYVYYPLGGSRKGKVRRYINILIVFTLSGIWHGASWNFVLWGFITGLIVVWNSMEIIGYPNDGSKSPKLKLPRPIGVILTFIGFSLSIVIFRSPDLKTAGQMFANLGKGWTGNIYRIASVIELPEIYVLKQAVTMLAPQMLQLFNLLVLIVMLIAGFYICSRKNSLEICEKYRKKAWFPPVIVLLLAYCIISFSQVSTFIYFNF